MLWMDGGKSMDLHNDFGRKTLTTHNDNNDNNDNANIGNSTSEQESISPLHVRFNEGADVTLMVREHDSIRKVKDLLLITLPDLQTRSLRLIHNGRLLLDDARIIDCIGNSPKVNMNFSRESSLKGKEPLHDLHDLPPIYFHCAVGEKKSNESSPIVVNEGNQITPLIGFDRLRTAGFNEQDILNLRTQFHRLRGRDVQVEGEGDDSSRQLEEAWIDNQDHNPILQDGGLDGTYMEMFQGLLIGFFFGLFAIFWFKEHGVFTARQQIAIIAGMVISASFGFLHVYY